VAARKTDFAEALAGLEDVAACRNNAARRSNSVLKLLDGIDDAAGALADDDSDKALDILNDLLSDFADCNTEDYSA